MTIICAYAPTAKAPLGVRSQFLEQLQDTLDDVPQDDTLVMLGDFNTRVGVFDPANGLWHGTVGRHGIAERNFAGEEFLQFCESNQLTVMNTCFEKKSVLHGTWVHPATKCCHMIDFIVMRTSQKRCCLDVQVMRVTDCWTDHYLVRGRLRMMLPQTAVIKKRPLPFAVHRFAMPKMRKSYVQSLEEKLSDWSLCESTEEEYWIHLRSCITNSAKESIGRGVRSNPEWFEKSVNVLKPLIEEKNQAHSRYLQVGTRSHKKTFRRLQRLVQKAVSNAKRKWILKVAAEGEEAVKDGSTRWDCIRKLQRVHGGRRPVRPTAVLKDDGQLTKGPEEVLDCWYQHFKKVLNVQSIYDDEVVAANPALEPMVHLDDPPTMEELKTALSRLKVRKAGGLSGILPEMILCGGPALHSRLLTLMEAVWREGEVFKDWKDAVIVPVPKKGNLQSCDNW